MKKIVASVGLVAVGVAGAQAYSPGLSAMDAAKTWSVSATLRGFYDDNYAYRSTDARKSYGFDVSPSVRFNLPLEQTYLGLRYIFCGRYYEDRDGNDPGGKNDPWDNSHQFDFLLNHTFSERYAIDVQDSFVVAQEPELLAPAGAPLTDVFRAEGNNIRNQARATLNAQMTRLLGLQVGYNNVLWDYEDKLAAGDTGASRSGLLDRMEHLALLNLRWQLQPETTAILGYNFGIVQYNGDEIIGDLRSSLFAPHEYVMSSDRDNKSHYVYAGLNQNFLSNVSASLKLGATYIDYDNNLVNSDAWIPYADISASFTYARGSYVQMGLVHSFNATDVLAPDAAAKTVTASQETTTIYGLVHHQITPKLVGSLHVHFQDSSFQGGAYDSETDQFLMLGANLTYQINRHFSCEAGYNFDHLTSDIPNRPFDRNRVYLGVTASY